MVSHTQRKQQTKNFAFVIKMTLMISACILRVIGKIVPAPFPCCLVGIEIAKVSIRVRDLLLTLLMPSPIGFRVVVPMGVFFGSFVI